MPRSIWYGKYELETSYSSPGDFKNILSASSARLSQKIHLNSSPGFFAPISCRAWLYDSMAAQSRNLDPVVPRRNADHWWYSNRKKNISTTATIFLYSELLVQLELWEAVEFRSELVEHPLDLMRFSMAELILRLYTSSVIFERRYTDNKVRQI